MAEKFDSTADVPYLARDAKTVGPGGGEDLLAEDVGTTVELTQSDETPDVEIMDDGSATVGEEEQTQEVGFLTNLAEVLDEGYLQALSNELLEKFENDKSSREEWEQGYTKGLDLLGFKYEERTRPFRGASSVNHPMLAQAVTQFQAMAYVELLPSDGPVRTQVVGANNEKLQQAAERVKDYMNYEITHKMEDYNPEMDQLLFQLPLSGSSFKKIYYDEVLGRATSKFIPAEDVIVPYGASDLDSCDRITQIVKLSQNDLRKKQISGFYRDIELTPYEGDNISDIQEKKNQIDGERPNDYSSDDMTELLEMHIDIDLEGYEDINPKDNQPSGIKLPYIVTIDRGSNKVLSVYRNFDQEDALRKKNEYFVHYKFLPGLGFYGFGLTHMIGGLSRTATQSLRQLLDAGTLSNLPAGFKSRGIRIRDDDQPFQPGEFRDVDAPGGNIKDQFQILPFKEPSATLYQLMGFVVQAGQKFAAITNMDTGNDMQNRAVGTTISLLERGSRVMSAIHKRCYYSMRREFRLLSKVFATYLPPIYPYSVYGADQAVKQTDFDDRVDVIPVADPNIMSMAQRVTLANENLKIAMSNPMMHNLREAYRRVYEALGTQDIDQILKPIERPIPKDPATENMEALMMKPLKAFPTQDHQAHITAHRAFMSTRMVQINPQVYAALQSHISEHVSLLAQGEVGAQIENDPNMQAMLQSDPEAAQLRIESMIAQRIATLTMELAQQEQMTSQQDPIVALKQRELDLKAMDMQRKAEESMMNMEIKENQIEEQLDIDKMKLENNEAQAAERIRIAEEKIELARSKKK